MKSQIDGKENILLMILAFSLMFLIAGAVGIAMSQWHWSNIGCVMTCP